MVNCEMITSWTVGKDGESPGDDIECGGEAVARVQGVPVCQPCLAAALAEGLPVDPPAVCEECGGTPASEYTTEGDGNYWLCDRDDEAHREKYCGWKVED